jgi:hypothetical protein
VLIISAGVSILGQSAKQDISEMSTAIMQTAIEVGEISGQLGRNS